MQVPFLFLIIIYLIKRKLKRNKNWLNLYSFHFNNIISSFVSKKKEELLKYFVSKRVFACFFFSLLTKNILKLTNTRTDVYPVKSRRQAQKFRPLWCSVYTHKLLYKSVIYPKIFFYQIYYLIKLLCLQIDIFSVWVSLFYLYSDAIE